MARINKSDVIQKAVNDLAISTSTDKVPNETLDKVQLTYDLNKKYSNFILTGGQSTTGAFNLATPNVSDRAETYITGIQASISKDATCDLATGDQTVSIVPDSSNISTALIRISGITLTADSQSVVFSLPYPIKVKNASNITFTGTFSLGVCRRGLGVIGFTTSSN